MWPGIDGRDRAGGRRLAREAHDAGREPVADAPGRALAPEAIELGDVPVSAGLVTQPLRQLLDDGADIAEDLHRRPPVVERLRRADAEHRRTRPARGRYRLERVEPDSYHEIGAAQQALVDARSAQHAEHQWVRIRQRALGASRRQQRRRQRLGDRAQPLRGAGGATVKAGEQQRAGGAGERAGRRVERHRVGIRERIGAARRRHGHGGARDDVGGDVEMDRAARLGHREPRGVGDPVRGGLGLDAERFLAGEHGGRVPAGQQDHGRAIQQPLDDARDGGRDARPRPDHDRAGRVDEIAGDRGHDARGGLAGRERQRKPAGARRLDQREVGPSARDTEDARRSGALQAVDDNLGDGRTAHAVRDGK